MSDAPANPTRLKRELGVFHAVLLGLGSILGTGVFVSIGIAAGIAGPSVLIAIVLAALLALCNGLSSAQLAAAHPVAGGTYEYAYQYLHPKLGFTAGWMFLLAKSASAATALLAVTHLLLPNQIWPKDIQRPHWSNFTGYLLDLPTLFLPITFTAIAILLACMFAVIAGVRRSAMINAILVAITLVGILCFAIYGAFILPTKFGHSHVFDMIGWHRADWTSLGWATAFMFVAYTGYGRIATLGEEVRDPKRTIPRAIIVCLGITAILYAIAAMGLLPIGRLPQIRRNPYGSIGYSFSIFILSDFGYFLRTIVYIAAITAMLSVLLNLVLGLSRVVLAMARRRDIHGRFALVNQAGTSPTLAVMLVCILIAMISVVGDIKTTWSFAAFTVLIYYGITNLAALRLPPENRLYPRAFAWAGLGGCFFLCWFVEPIIWLIGLKLIVLGLLWHTFAPRLFGPPPSPTEVCTQCGYDLRASTGHCPECGEAIPKPSSNAAMNGS